MNPIYKRQLSDSENFLTDKITLHQMKIFYVLIISATLLKTVIAQTDIKQPLLVGDHFGGGIIFSIDPTGQHGLIAAISDIPEKTCWGDEGWTNASLMNEGASNTEKIVFFMNKKRLLQCTPAACMCDTLTVGGYSDWYLPSINELKGMYDKQSVIGNFAAGNYQWLNGHMINTSIKL